MDKYQFIITNLDAHTINLEPYQYGGANITTIRIVDATSVHLADYAEYMKKVAKDEQKQNDGDENDEEAKNDENPEEGDNPPAPEDKDENSEEDEGDDKADEEKEGKEDEGKRSIYSMHWVYSLYLFSSLPRIQYRFGSVTNSTDTRWYCFIGRHI